MLLFKGDCLELMKDIPDESIDLILCDLPYGTTDCKWDTIIPFAGLWHEYNRIIKEDGAIVLFATEPFTAKLINSNFNQFRYVWYWKKNNVTGGQYAKVQPMRCMEEIVVFYKKKPTYNPQGLVRLDKPITYTNRGTNKVYEWCGHNRTSIQRYTNYPKNFLEFNKDSKIYHSTQKPIDLLEYLIRTYTNEGETVLDNCMGSGSTGVACMNTNRRFIGMELDESIFNIAKNRIAEKFIYSA